MGNTFNIYSVLALLSCLLTGLFFAWLLYGKSTDLPKPFRITLAIIRALTISLILWFLFSPLIKQVSYTLEKPIVIIAQDNSQSAGNILPVGFDSVKYRKALQQLSRELSEQYDVKEYSFGDQVSSGLNFNYKGKLTNAAAFSAQITDQFRNRNVGAVIMATDGIFNRGGNPTLNLEQLKAPVFTIALGDTIPKKDWLIANVNANELVFLDNDFTIEVQVQAYQFSGKESKIIIEEDGKKLSEQLIRINGPMFSKNFPVRLKASKLGHHQYVISLSPLSGEISVKNNVQRISVEVIDNRQKILIAAAAPHPDIAALKQAIALNKHYSVAVILNEDLLKVDPKSYGLIILYQLPDQQFNAQHFTDKLLNAKNPLWYIIGAQSNIGGFNQLQNQVNISGNNGSLQYVYSDINKNGSAFDLDSASRKLINSFDPLQSPFGTLKVSGPNQAIFNQRIGKVKTDYPQLFFMNDNGRKTGFLLGEGLWKWKLAEGAGNADAPVFNGLIGKIVQFLSVKDDKRKFKVYPAKNTFDESEHIIFNAALYNDSYQPVNTPDVNIAVKGQNNKVFNFTFSKFESTYQLDAGILPAGNYSYIANTSLGDKKYTAQGTFTIKEQLAEFQQTIANHQLLYLLSQQTNGKLCQPDELMKLKDELLKGDQLKTLSYEDIKYEELINLKWLFALIILLLSTEWFLRKRNAML